MIYFWLALGAIVGSFLNVCIYRLPRGESVVWPPSHCPDCGQPLAFYDLVPFASYLLLLGRCRNCRATISLRYPLVELLTAAAFVGIAAVTLSPLDLAFRLAFVCVLIVIFFTDLEWQLIPDAAIVTGIGASLLYNLALGFAGLNGFDFNPLFGSLFGLIVGYVVLWAVAKLGGLLFRKEAMGEGDIYLAALLGSALGWGGMLLALFLGCLIATIISLLLLLLRRVRFGQYIPFGPALALGGLIVLFWGQAIWFRYLGIFS